MNKLSFDPAVNLDLYFRKGRNSDRKLIFKNEDGTAFDISANEFEFIAQFVVAITVASNELTLTILEVVKPGRDSFFYEIKNITTGQTWFTGTAYFTDGQSAEQDNTDEIVMQLAGDTVEVTMVNAVTGGSGRWRGSFSTADEFPEDDVRAGDQWHVTVETILDGETWPAKTIITALEDTPGQDVDKWRIA